MGYWRRGMGEAFFLTAHASRADKWSYRLPRFVAPSRYAIQSRAELQKGERRTKVRLSIDIKIIVHELL